MDIKFFYQSKQSSREKEVIITSFSNAVSRVIDLPPSLEVCLYSFPGNVYGGIDMNVINRIGLNYNLPVDAIPMILTHELIHVHQKHTGKLKTSPNGSCYWNGIFYTKTKPEDMSHEDYQNLPWELDVANKQQKIFSEALKLV